MAETRNPDLAVIEDALRDLRGVADMLFTMESSDFPPSSELLNTLGVITRERVATLRREHWPDEGEGPAED